MSYFIHSSIMFFYAVVATTLLTSWLASPSSAAAPFSLQTPLLQTPTQSDATSTALLRHYQNNNNNRSLQQQQQTTPQQTQQQPQEEERPSKYSTLNSILSTVTLSLPDAQISESGLDLTITEITCRDLNVDDVKLDHSPLGGSTAADNEGDGNNDNNTDNSDENSDIYSIGVKLDGVHISCDFRWEYSWTIFSGTGSGTASSDGPSSSISLDIHFISEDYSASPPNEVDIENCNTDLQIANIDVEEDPGGLGVIDMIMGTFEGIITNALEGQLGELVCDELVGMLVDGNEGDDGGEEGEEGGGAFNDMLSMASDWIGGYLPKEDVGEGSAAVVDPLYAENNADVPTDEDGNSLWINFIEVEEFTQELTGLELNGMVESILGSSSSSLRPSSSSTGATERADDSGGEEELGINSFLRNSVLNEDGLLVIDPSTILPNNDDNNDSTTLFEMNNTFMQTTLSISSVSIGGLDTFRTFNILDPIGNYTLQNNFELDQLSILVELQADIAPSSKSDAVVAATIDSPPSVTESFVLEIAANDVAVDLALFLGINTQTLGSIPLGSIIHMENIPSCLLSAVDDAELTALSVTVGDMTSPTLSGFLDQGLDELISTFGDALFAMYEQSLIQAMPNLIEMTVRDMVNDFIDDALSDGENACPDPDSSLDGLVDYRDLFLSEEESVELLGRGGSPYGELFRLLYTFLDEIMSSVDEDGLSWLNAVIAQFTGLQTDENGGELVVGDLFSESVDISLNGLNAEIELGVSDVRVSNLNSLGAIHLLQPMKGESSVLNNTASIGVGPEAIQIEFTLLIKGKGDKVEFHNEVELGLSLKDMVVMLQILAQMQEQPFLNFPLQDLTNLHCWIATIGDEPESPGLALRELSVAIAEAQFDMKCIDCSSPMMLELEEAMNSQDGVADTTEVANRVFDFASGILSGGLMQRNVDQMLNEAAYQCPHNPLYQQDYAGLVYEELAPIEANEDSYGFLIAILVVIVVVIASVTIIFVAARWFSWRRHRRWLTTLNKAQKLELQQMEQDEKERERDMNKRMRSLVRSKEIPLFVRLFIPIVILGNIALFLSGHLSLGGTVNISGSFAGEDFEVEGFFEFSMAKSTIEMWNAGAKELAILILLFSGIWPYTKQLITLFVWFAPTRWVASKRRGKILHWLDVLGKWSMVDIFVLLITLAAFNLSIESPRFSFLPDSLYSINMLVIPLWGLYANMLAQLVSQVSSHIIIHYHRKTVRAATKSQETDLNLTPTLISTNTPAKLRTHNFKLDYEASSKRAIVRKGVNWILLAALLCLTVLVMCGCILPSFSMEVLGLVGLMVESGNNFEEAKTYYSVFDLAQMIMDQARYIGEASDYIGLGTLASLLVITVFIVPLAQAGSLLAQWFAPMGKKQRTRNTVLNEILSAWQYMEVYVFSIIIGAWQLGGISDFMINAYCGGLQNTFTSLVNYGVIESEDAQCFRVDATVETASWLLVAASLVLGILNHFIQSASYQKTQDENTPAERRLHTDRWSQDKLPQSTLDDDEEAANGTAKDDDKKVNVSPISPRFTDYYYFATTYRTEEKSQDRGVDNVAVETAVVSTNENNGESSAD